MNKKNLKLSIRVFLCLIPIWFIMFLFNNYRIKAKRENSCRIVLLNNQRQIRALKRERLSPTGKLSVEEIDKLILTLEKENEELAVLKRKKTDHWLYMGVSLVEAIVFAGITTILIMIFLIPYRLIKQENRHNNTDVRDSAKASPEI